MAFFTSTELPTTQFLPITALPRMKAQWRSLGAVVDDGRAGDGGRGRDDGVPGDPHVLAGALVLVLAERLAQFDHESADLGQHLPGVADVRENGGGDALAPYRTDVQGSKQFTHAISLLSLQDRGHCSIRRLNFRVCHRVKSPSFVAKQFGCAPQGINPGSVPFHRSRPHGARDVRRAPFLRGEGLRLCLRRPDALSMPRRRAVMRETRVRKTLKTRRPRRGAL